MDHWTPKRETLYERGECRGRSSLADGPRVRLSDLVVDWREKSREFREHAVDAVGIAYERCADQLDEALRALDEEALTLQEAAEESGYSYSALQQMVSNDRLKNAGTKNKPRIRRGDLPRKAQAARRSTGGPDLASEILARRVAS